MTFTDNTPLGQARAYARAGANEKDGVPCPCCTQRVKVYERTINSGMARALILMYRAGGTDWVHLPTVLKGYHADEAKLRYWGLIEQADVTREDGSRRAGWWRVTSLGRAFVLGHAQVPRIAYVYDGRGLGLDATETISIHDALNAKFDYRELMGGRS